MELVEELAALRTLGLELPSPAYIFGAIVFGLIGLAAFRYGRKRQRSKEKAEKNRRGLRPAQPAPPCFSKLCVSHFSLLSLPPRTTKMV